VSNDDRRAAVWKFMQRGLSIDVMVAILGVSRSIVQQDVRWHRTRLGGERS
jgi:transposase